MIIVHDIYSGLPYSTIGDWHVSLIDQREAPRSRDEYYNLRFINRQIVFDLIGACEVSRREDEEENGLESDEDPLLEDAEGESSGEDAY